MRTLTAVMAILFAIIITPATALADAHDECRSSCGIYDDETSKTLCEEACKEDAPTAQSSASPATAAMAPATTTIAPSSNVMDDINAKFAAIQTSIGNIDSFMADQLEMNRLVMETAKKQGALLNSLDPERVAAATKAAEDAAKKAEGYNADMERMKGDMYGKGKGVNHDIGVVTRSRLNRTKIYGNPDEEPDGLPAAHEKIRKQEEKILSLEAHITAINTTVYNNETGVKALNDRLDNEETGLQAAHDNIFWNRMGAGAFFLIVCCVIWYSRRLFLNHEHETEKSTPEAESAKVVKAPKKKNASTGKKPPEAAPAAVPAAPVTASPTEITVNVTPPGATSASSGGS